MIEFYTKNRPYFEFSNFYETEIIIDGKVYKSSEHYYQSQKFDDPEAKEYVRLQPSPKLAKKATFREEFKIKDNWNEIKEEVMLKALRMKFQKPKLKNLLLNTGNDEIVEYSTKDWYWGSGSDYTGQNRLGKLIMKVREEIRSQEKEKKRFFDWK